MTGFVKVAGQAAFAIAVTMPTLIGFMLGIVRWSRRPILLGATVVLAATVVAATASSTTWRIIAPIGAAFVLVGFGIGTLTRRLAERVTH